jgi:hypothetical protein
MRCRVAPKMRIFSTVQSYWRNASSDVLLSCRITTSGLSLNASTGVISGTPTTEGQFSFIMHVADGAGADGSQGLSITIASALTLTTAALPNGTVNAPYSRTVAAAGGTQPLVWSISAGALPAGLSLDSATGGISERPQLPAPLTSRSLQWTRSALLYRRHSPS